METKNHWHKFSTAPPMKHKVALISVERRVVFSREFMLLDPKSIPSQFDECRNLPVGMYRGLFSLGFSNSTWRPSFNNKNEPIAIHPEWDSLGCVVTLQIRAERHESV